MERIPICSSCVCYEQAIQTSTLPIGMFGYSVSIPQVTGILAEEGGFWTKDLDRFHARYEELSDRHPHFREDAFKILAVHHHPLPVNWDSDWKQRWLTECTNAVAFFQPLLYDGLTLCCMATNIFKRERTCVVPLEGKLTTNLQF